VGTAATARAESRIGDDAEGRSFSRRQRIGKLDDRTKERHTTPDAVIARVTRCLPPPNDGRGDNRAAAANQQASAPHQRRLTPQPSPWLPTGARRAPVMRAFTVIVV